jgi:hydroxyethylthiazole kinase-like uncharacterized protein yjeF
LKIKEELVYLTAEEMAEFDRAAIEDFGIDEIILMENAGVAVANAARRSLDGKMEGRKICCLVGKGNNGGDGIVAARHLNNWGARVKVVLGGERIELREIPAKQLSIVEKLGIPVGGPDADFDGADLLVDALFGYNLKGNPREPTAALIRRANSSKIKILAVDIPSGLDATTGDPGDPCIMARTTVTLGLPKTGFLSPKAKRHLGSVYLADISFPEVLYTRLSQKKRLFAKDSLLRVS